MPDRVPGVVCVASWNADLVVRVPRPAARGETQLASQFTISPGGKGSNAAVAAARQDAQVALIARIGDDDFGRMGLALWQAEGVDTRHVEVAPGERSGIAQIQVFDDGDNSIAVYAGANAGLSAAHAKRAASVIGQARVVMASNEVPQACARAVFALARSTGVTTLLNPAPALELPDDLLSLVDVLTPNEGELRKLAGLPTDADEARCVAALQARGAGHVVVTLGAAGCRLHSRGNTAPVALPGHVVPVVDTIGAGDTFTGVLAAALARGDELAQAIAQANAGASLAVQAAGAITGMPTRAAVTRQLVCRSG